MANLPAPASYTKLLTDISALCGSARKAIVEAYWRIGQCIVQVEQKGEIRSAYGSGLITQLSEDLTRRLGPGFSPNQLLDMRRFYLAYSNSRPAVELGWSQHVELLRVGDLKQRKALVRRVIRERLKRDQLRRLVRQEMVRKQVAGNLASKTSGNADVSAPRPAELLVPRRGILYAYRILDPKTFQSGEANLRFLDLGFACYRDLDAVTGRTFTSGEIVQSVRTGEDQYQLDKLPGAEPASLYTYQATVEKVVDGDTLRVIVDLGFNTRTRQYLRLRGVDCPELATEEGKQASTFVKSRLRGADQILLTSSRSDKYDRYLADVYFTDREGGEIFLNNLLLEKGLAVRSRTSGEGS
ncbi:MAG TPA: DUF1016 N-terminal domain-containing protein [Candidatus Omnitrophota bacterium]|nr:DUF1016 N-terminal domain-containing protein [Candidatus Omnitrophota bacterium]